MDGGKVVFTFEGDTKDLEKKTKNIGTSVSNIIKGSLASKAIAKGVGVINENLDGAIKRVDTMNQFPKVMQLFGVSADEANKSIKRIDKSVRGLPTSLDQAVAGVQDIFTVTKNLPEAEKMFKAINDSAMVFANGSTDAVSRFTYAYKQALSAGKIQAQDFNQMNEAIPGLMSKVAEAMGVTFAQLKSGLSDGSISMDDFNKALQTLDTQGVGSMKSLGESAKTSTDGIQTSISNLKTAITRGIANSIQSINDSLKQSNLPSIPEIIKGISNGVNTLFNSVIIPALKVVIPFLAKIGQWMKNNPQEAAVVVTAIGGIITSFKLLSSLGSGIIAISNGFKILKDGVGIATSAFSGLSSIIGVVGGAFKALGAIMLANPISIIIALIVGLIAGLVLLYNKCEWFRDGVNAVVGAIRDFFVSAFNVIKSVVSTVFEFIGNYISLKINLARAVIQIAINAIIGAFNWLKSGATAIINGIVSIFWVFVSFVASIPGRIVGFFASLPSNLFNVGKNLLTGLWNGINNAFGWVIGKIKGIGNTILKTIKNIFGVHSPSKEFAWIGKMNMVGLEEGMEGMQPKVQSMIDGMFDLSPTLTGTASTNLSPNIVVNNNINMETDPLGQMVKKVKTFSGGAKNDYNYGMGA